MPLSTECSVVCEDEKQARVVEESAKNFDRPMYSNPPVHGALIVSTILGDPDLKKLWLKEVKRQQKESSLDLERLASTRKRLHEKYKEAENRYFTIFWLY
ncbi:hypothetical protein LOK49_LG06G01596 [Camellia lanceoleosa]|uniref:Uncharacterized protein n=1 Tax=Camellia lanceoleosa TaxID=1840588 RepID=A0ACC0HE88_9ERIC|nr:hypothetical protein LOK49_LG06G01596 [Camellia lanceoleosa]